MDTTYDDRPVWTWPTDWATLPTSRIEYDLRTLALGFGTDLLYGEQDHVVRGWQFVAWADSEAEIQELDDFFDDLTGRLVGFWLPTPEVAFRIVDGISGTQFTVADCGLADWWADHPDAYLWLTKDGSDPQGAQITAVVDNGDGTETVTTSETVTADETWKAVWLAYVRLASDDEQAEFTAESRLKRTVSTVELPTEYSALETGAKPVWFYHFWTEEGTQVDWRFTSLAWDLAGDYAVNGLDWTAERISHGSLAKSTRGATSVSIEVERIEPASLMVPPTLAQPLFVSILKSDFSTIGFQTTEFTGRVTGARTSGKRITLECTGHADAAGKCPAMLFSRRCNYRLYQSVTCGVTQASYEVAVTIDTISGRTVTVSGVGLSGLAADYLALGWIETGSDDETDRKTILSSTAESGGSVTLTLNAPLSWAVVTDSATVVPGCDGKAATCTSKFSNFANFGGHLFALRNLALQAIEVPAASPGKK